MTTEIDASTETIEYGDFADLLKPDSKWAIGGFPGWEFREPNAVAVVQNGRLRVSVAPLTRTNNAIQFFEGMAKIDPTDCVGCSRCITACPQKAINVQWNESSSLVMKKMAEYATGALSGKKEKILFLNFITQVSPACDCYGHSDAPIVNDIGICASIDPVALDQACADLVNGAVGNSNSALGKGFEPGEDKFRGVYPEIDWEVQLEHAEKMGIGCREYELFRI